MTLAAEHVAELRESSIPLELAARAGLYSLHDVRAVTKLSRTPRDAWSDEHFPALVFPYYVPTHGAEAAVTRIKPRKPLTMIGRDGQPTERKYLHPSKGSTHIYFPPSMLDDARRLDASIGLLVTEGEKKTLAAEAHGFACVGVAGVSMWSAKRLNNGPRKLHADFAHLTIKGRDVAIVFDSDAPSNFGVKLDEEAFAKALLAAGATPRIVRLPPTETGDKQGLDDFLAAHGELGAAKLRELIDAARVVERPKSDGPPAEPWHELLSRDGKDRPQRTAHNAMVYLVNDPSWAGVLAYDERAGAVLFQVPPPFHEDYAGDGTGAPREMRDADIVRVQMWLERAHGLALPKDPVRDAVLATARRTSFNPVRDYLAGLRWDGVPRIESWLTTFLGVEDTEYARAVGSRWLISAVARAFEPGCKADHVLVLEGLQGKGKSTALEILAGGGRYFTDEIGTIGNKDSAIQLQGVWIVELGELDAMKRADVTAVKAYLSRKDDRFRAPWGTVAESHPRRCVFAGSTNSQDYLRDETGNRRFWPVAVPDTFRIDTDGLRAARDSLWAEAVAQYHARAPWHLDTESLARAAHEQQSARRAPDPWEEPIRTWLREPKQLRVGRVTTVQALTEALKLEVGRIGRAEETRVGVVLLALGCHRVRMTRAEAAEAGIASRGRYYLIPGPTLVRPRTNAKPENVGPGESEAITCGCGADSEGGPTGPTDSVETHAGARAPAHTPACAQAGAHDRARAGAATLIQLVHLENRLVQGWPSGGADQPPDDEDDDGGRF